MNRKIRLVVDFDTHEIEDTKTGEIVGNIYQHRGEPVITSNKNGIPVEGLSDIEGICKFVIKK